MRDDVVFSYMLYMLVRYASPSGPLCLRCLMLTLSGPVELFYCLLDLCCGECNFGCLQFECFPINVSVCFVLGNCLLNALCDLSVRTVMKLCTFGVFNLGVSFVS